MWKGDGNVKSPLAPSLALRDMCDVLVQLGRGAVSGWGSSVSCFLHYYFPSPLCHTVTRTPGMIHIPLPSPSTVLSSSPPLLTSPPPAPPWLKLPYRGSPRVATTVDKIEQWRFRNQDQLPINYDVMQNVPNFFFLLKAFLRIWDMPCVHAKIKQILRNFDWESGHLRSILYSLPSPRKRSSPRSAGYYDGQGERMVQHESGSSILYKSWFDSFFHLSFPFLTPHFRKITDLATNGSINW